MRKILLLTLLLALSMVGTVWAYSDNSTADAQKTIDSIQDIKYNVDAGVTFNNYDSLISKATVNLKRYSDKYPANDKDSRIEMLYGQLLDYYTCARQVWSMGIISKYDILDSDQLALVFAKVPTLKSKLTPISTDKNAYFYKDVLQALWVMASDFEKNINKQQ